MKRNAKRRQEFLKTETEVKNINLESEGEEDDDDVKEEEYPFECPKECGVNFKSDFFLKEHTNYCNICEILIEDSENGSNDHIKHPQCKGCIRSFKNSNEVNIHMKSCFNCFFCGKLIENKKRK